MKVLKIKLYQEMVNYRKSYSFNFIESYPLPTPSMIRGWIYGVINAENREEYYRNTINNLKVSVNGVSDGFTYDLQHMEKWKDNFGEKTVKTPTYVTLISAIELNIYISGDDKLLNDFKDNIFNKYPSLGRYEDVANIKSIEYVDLEERSYGFFDGVHNINYDTYITKEKARVASIKGSYLRLPLRYEIVNKTRIFKNANLLFLSNIGNLTLSDGSFYYDDIGDRIIDFIKF